MYKKIALINCIGKEEEYPFFYSRFQKIANDTFGKEVDLLKNGSLCYILNNNNEEILYGNTPLDINSYFVVFSRFAISSSHSGDYYVLRAFEKNAVPVINPAQSIAKSKDKLHTLSILSANNIPITPTIIARNHEELDGALDKISGPPYIVKNNFGSKGKGVLLAYDKIQLRSIFDYVWRINRNEILLVQPFLKVEPFHQDVRVLCLGYEKQYAMTRTAYKNDFRTNVEFGSKVTITDLSNEERKICTQAAQALQMPFCGIDFIRTDCGPKVLEINSCPGISGISEAYQESGVDILTEIVGFISNYEVEK